MLLQRQMFLLASVLIATLAGVAFRYQPVIEKPQLVGVRGLGALGDGITDDTNAIQKAIDAGTGSVVFPSGVYRITRPLLVNLERTGPIALTGDGTATLKMSGQGPAIQIAGTHGGTALPATVKPEVWNRQRMPMISGLDIAGDHPEADGIRASGTLMLTIHRVGIRHCRHGIHLIDRNRNLTVSDSHIYSNKGIGIYYDNVNLHQSNIIGCHISYCEGGGIVCRGGEVRNVQIGTCDIEANMAKDGASTANILIDCQEGSTAEVAISGCTIQHSNVKGSANIRILGMGKGIRKDTIGSWGHVTIQGNVLSDVEDNIHLKGCRGVTITGNTLWMGYKSNLNVEGCEQIVLGANMMERNPAYDYGTSKETINAVVFKSCRDCSIAGIHLHNVKSVEAGIVVDDCHRCNITACTVLDCSPIGILMRNCTKCRVSDCLILSDDKQDGMSLPLKVIGGDLNQVSHNHTGIK